MEVPLKTRNRATTLSSNSTPGHVYGKNENTNLQRYMHPNVHSSTIYNSQDIHVSNPRTHQQTTGLRFGTFTTECYSVINKRNTAICSNVVGPTEHYAW